MHRSALLLSTLILCAPTPGAAQFPQLDRAVQEVTPRMVEIRHHLHQNPELGNREFETARLVADYLREIGLDEVRTGIAHTGVVGILHGGKPGPVVAVRADMDALPVAENTPYPFRSTVRTTYLGQDVGVSHACGHDIHTAVELGLATVLASLRADLPGTVVFIFQPAEEGAPPGEEGGAALMVKEGVLDDPAPEAIFGLHTNWNMPVGVLGYTPGPALAASDHFTATIHGRGAHGAQPEVSVDPVVMAAEAVMALQTIRSRNMSPIEPGVVTVGLVRGGTRFNIIPDDVLLEGTVRSYHTETQDLVERRMREILGGVTAAGGGSYELTYERGIPVTINDVALTERMVRTLERAVGTGNVQRLDPATVAEDFAYFANEIPGFYYRLGTLKPGTISGNHHTPTFQADDTAIPVGIKAMAYLVWEYLAGVRR
ncbi:MAG: amidohydrolase [Gemmatimonadales bacterium]|nr:amidohydrolase [Gemmatimonadales bacterium]